MLINVDQCRSPARATEICIPFASLHLGDFALTSSVLVNRRTVGKRQELNAKPQRRKDEIKVAGVELMRLIRPKRPVGSGELKVEKTMEEGLFTNPLPDLIVGIRQVAH